MIVLRSLLAPMLALLVTPAFANQSAEERLAPGWQALDTNKDGKVLLTELHPLQAGAMKTHDVDGNGVISLEEYVAYDLDPGGAAFLPLPENVRLIENISYTGTADGRQQLDVYLPKEAKVDGPLPVIAYIHGGGWARGSKVSARSQIPPLVNSGRFAAVSIGYRLSWQDPWPAQIHDVKAGIRWIRAHAQEYGLDPDRICAFGPSAGGHLVAMLGTTNGVESVEGTLGKNIDQSSDVQCVVDFFGPSDLRSAEAVDPMGNPSMVSKLLGGPADDNPALAANASPLVHVDATDVPFLIVHGTRDPLVKFSDSVELEAALAKAGVPVVFQAVKGGGHGTFGSAIDEVDNRVRDYLEKMFYDPARDVSSDLLDAEL